MAEMTAPPSAPTVPTPAPARTAPHKQIATVAHRLPNGVTRREFLYYIWGASMALILAETAGVSVLFALPRIRAGQFGGIITTAAAEWPKPNGTPVPNPAGGFWMTSLDEGIIAQYKVCTHLGCLYKWDENSQSFSCPCHGTLFKINGDWSAGPAPRGLDRFALRVLNKAGQLLAESPDGRPIPLPADAHSVQVDTGRKIPGKSRF